MKRTFAQHAEEDWMIFILLMGVALVVSAIRGL